MCNVLRCTLDQLQNGIYCAGVAQSNATNTMLQMLQIQLYNVHWIICKKHPLQLCVYLRTLIGRPNQMLQVYFCTFAL